MSSELLNRVESFERRQFVELTDENEHTKPGTFDLVGQEEEQEEASCDHKPGIWTRMHNFIGHIWEGIREGQIQLVQLTTPRGEGISEKTGIGALTATNMLDAILKDNWNEKLNAKGRHWRHLARDEKQAGIIKRIGYAAAATFFYAASALAYIARAVLVTIVGIVTLAFHLLVYILNGVFHRLPKWAWNKITKPQGYEKVDTEHVE